MVFQALAHTLALGPEVWRVLDKAHALRNQAEYEGYFDVDERMLAGLLAATEVVRKAVQKLGPVPKGT